MPKASPTWRRSQPQPTGEVVSFVDAPLPQIKFLIYAGSGADQGGICAQF